MSDMMKMEPVETKTAPDADALAAAKRRLLERRIRGEVKPAPQVPAIVRRGGGPAYPMSFTQERLWFLDQLEPGNPMYNIALAELVSARIDVPTLERAFAEIVRRHEGLRTVFRLVDGRPTQVVVPPHPVPVEVEDLRGPGGEAAPEEVVRRRASAEASVPFSLADGPLVRARLFRVSEADFVLFLNVHHVVTDGWSMPIVTREIEELYEAFRKGLPSRYPELDIHYPDYALWQRDYLQGAVLEKQLGYWTRHLEGAPALLDLPTDRPRPAAQTHRGAIHRFFFPRALGERLRDLARGEGASLNMAVLAGFNLLLQRYSGQSDVVVGTLLGNRNRVELEPVVGFFVNTVAVRTRLEDDPTFRDLLRRTRATVLEADAHQEVPFDMVVDALKVERDLSRHPLFQVMYFHHTFVKTVHHREEDAFQTELNLRSLFGETGVSVIDMGTTKFDLMLTTIEHGDAFPSHLEYSTDLFDEATVARMMDHLAALLQSATEDPEVPVSHLSMLRPGERDSALALAVDGRSYPAETVVARFEQQAWETPDVPAVVHGAESLTYRALNEQANRIAHRLRSLGIGPEDRVAVCLPRTPALVAALYGVLKAGGAYVPVDPAYPPERIALLLADAGARAVLADAATAARLPADAMVVRVDDPGLAASPSTDPEPLATPENLAWVIYTSGSTGRPKGVMVRHSSAAAFLAWMRETFPLAPGSRVLGATSVSFDVHVADLHFALASGATLVLVRDALSLAEPGLGEGVVHAAMVPAAAAELVRLGMMPPTLHTLVLAGEALPPALARDVYERTRVRRLVNAYGPTEDTTYSTWAEVPRDAERVTIGRPVGARRAYVLDARLEQAPTGVPGELWLAGAGVARGYLDRPALTAERFVPDPFSAEPGARMYRTGDRARRLADGDLEYLGRVDEQVKVRGFRVEPGEVEQALRAHPAVREAAVGVSDAEPVSRLTAWVVPSSRADGVDGEALRLWLKERLPDYMVPSAVVAIDALPLTSSGKVDRRRLPMPTQALAARAGEAEPRNEVERALIRLWAEALGLPRVGIHDNFFALGGDSILSIQIVARAGQEGLRLTPRQMFSHQTVAELTTVTEMASVNDTAEQGPVTGPVPLASAQRWFLEQERPDPHHFNLSLVMEPREVLDSAALRRAAAVVVAHHDALRLRFRRAADGWVQENADASDAVAFDSIDLSDVPEEKREAEFTFRAARVQAGLDLERGPLVRFALFDLGAGRPQRLLLAAHHLVMDVVSWSVVAEDLETAYRQAARGETVVLPLKTTSFRQWAVRLAEHARSDDVRREAGFWLAQSHAPFLPVDHPEARDTEGEAAALTVALSADDTRALLREVPPVYNTQVNDALLAALALAFRRWTGDRALLIDLEGHGREELFDGVDVSRTVGWFTAIHPLLLELPAADEPGAALRAVKERLRAVPNKGAGYGLLRWMADDELAERLRALPRPQVSFNYLGQLDSRAGTSERGLFADSAADAGPQRAPAAPRAHRISVDAAVTGGRLRVTWSFGSRAYERATIERLAEAYLAALREIVEHCRHPHAGGFTPSDFDLAGLDQEELDALLGGLRG
jgi:amino acid adenylation domain-containing protein/non-ribosomal peptide synthase protein (TIGR01720 family)